MKWSQISHLVTVFLLSTQAISKERVPEKTLDDLQVGDRVRVTLSSNYVFEGSITSKQENPVVYLIRDSKSGLQKLVPLDDLQDIQYSLGTDSYAGQIGGLTLMGSVFGFVGYLVSTLEKVEGQEDDPKKDNEIEIKNWNNTHAIYATLGGTVVGFYLGLRDKPKEQWQTITLGYVDLDIHTYPERGGMVMLELGIKFL